MPVVGELIGGRKGWVLKKGQDRKEAKEGEVDAWFTLGCPTSDKAEEGLVGAKAAVSAKPVRKRITRAFSIRIF
jgi:hypothetical protein